MSSFKDKYLKYKIKYTNLSGGNPEGNTTAQTTASNPDKPPASASAQTPASKPGQTPALKPAQPIASKPVQPPAPTPAQKPVVVRGESLNIITDDQLDDLSMKTIKIIKDISLGKDIDTVKLKEHVSELELISEEIRKRHESKSLKHLHALTDDQLDSLSIRTIKTIKDISTSKDLDVSKLKEYVSYQELIAEEIKKRYDLKSTVKP